MKTRAALAVAGSLLLLPLSSTAYALDEGVPDGDRHPNVGLIGVDVDRDGPIAGNHTAMVWLWYVGANDDPGGR